MKKDSIILSVGEKNEVSISDVANIIARKFNYEHNIKFDISFSDGLYKKTANNKKLLDLHGLIEFTSIKEGIGKSIDWFIENYETCRK